jgi:hypothetical protein
LQDAKDAHKSESGSEMDAGAIPQSDDESIEAGSSDEGSSDEGSSDDGLSDSGSASSQGRKKVGSRVTPEGCSPGKGGGVV